MKPIKKPTYAVNTPEAQAAVALEHLQRGRFRDAIECYKALLKAGPRPEWLAQSSLAYEGRAKALAAKGMRREAIELWRSRAEVCRESLWEGPYAGWLIAEGRLAEVLGYLSKRRAASDAGPDGKADAGLAALEARLAPGLLSADDATLKQLPAESLLLQHRPLALAALAAYASQDGLALEDALAGISFRSPYRDLRSVLKAMVLCETDHEAARAVIDRVPPDGPFESLAAPLRDVVATSGPERLRRSVGLDNSQQLIALDLLGWPHALAPLLQALPGARGDLAPAALFDLMHRNARALPEALATRLWQWLAPWARRRGCASPAIFGKPSKAHQECATALAVEIKGELEHAEEHWLRSVQLLADSGERGDRQRAALVLRHMAGMSEQLSREGKFDKAGAGYWAQSLEFDPLDCDVHVRLVQFWRHRGNLKTARERLDAGLALFPDSVALLTEAVEIALAAGAFKKAATTARRLLELSPLDRRVRPLVGHAHLSHAGKHISAGKFERARQEIEEARGWLVATPAQGRMHLLLAWTEPEGSTERRRLAQLAVTTWGGGLAAGWRLVREAQGLFAHLRPDAALRLLAEAGIQSTGDLTADDVLALVRVLEQEPPIARKGVSPLLVWRKALGALAPAALFDAETSVRICEALGCHEEHDLLERFATFARKRWPDWPVFVYHAVAARRGKSGCIETERDFADLERARDRARRNKDFKLESRIETLFEAEDALPDLYESDGPDAPLSLDPRAFRAVVEQSIEMDGGINFLENVRRDFGKELIRQVEKECGGDKKAVWRRLIDLVVARFAIPIDQPVLEAPAKEKKPLVKPVKIVKPKTPAEGKGSLFDE